MKKYACIYFVLRDCNGFPEEKDYDIHCCHYILKSLDKIKYDIDAVKDTHCIALFDTDDIHIVKTFAYAINSGTHKLLYSERYASYPNYGYLSNDKFDTIGTTDYFDAIKYRILIPNGDNYIILHY